MAAHEQIRIPTFSSSCQQTDASDCAVAQQRVAKCDRRGDLWASEQRCLGSWRVVNDSSSPLQAKQQRPVSALATCLRLSVRKKVPPSPPSLFKKKNAQPVLRSRRRQPFIATCCHRFRCKHVKTRASVRAEQTSATW